MIPRGTWRFPLPTVGPSSTGQTVGSLRAAAKSHSTTCAECRRSGFVLFVTAATANPDQVDSSKKNIQFGRAKHEAGCDGTYADQYGHTCCELAFNSQNGVSAGIDPGSPHSREPIPDSWHQPQLHNNRPCAKSPELRCNVFSITIGFSPNLRRQRLRPECREQGHEDHGAGEAHQ